MATAAMKKIVRLLTVLEERYIMMSMMMKSTLKMLMMMMINPVFKDFDSCKILGFSFSILGEVWGWPLCQDKTCL